MVYKVNKIACDVRIAIDENKLSRQLILDEDIDTLTLDEIIGSKIGEAVRRVILLSPVHLLDGGKPFGDSICWGDGYSGWILLPEDFLRLMVFRMNDWERPVYEAITGEDPRYELQHSRYRGIRGTSQRPVVSIVVHQEGLALEFYSCKSKKAEVSQGLYYPLPKIDHDGGIYIPRRCYRSCVYEAASLVCATIGQNEMSTILSDLGRQLLV